MKRKIKPYSTNQPGKPAGLAAPTNRCGHCQGDGKRRKVFFVRAKKVRPEVAYKAVVRVIERIRADYVAGRQTRYMSGVTREGLAVELGLHKDCIHLALMRLVREGVLETKRNMAPHDSSRDRWHWGKGDSAWMASFYQLRGPEAPEEGAE